jgi:hypothetical protein
MAKMRPSVVNEFRAGIRNAVLPWRGRWDISWRGALLLVVFLLAVEGALVAAVVLARPTVIVESLIEQSLQEHGDPLRARNEALADLRDIGVSGLVFRTKEVVRHLLSLVLFWFLAGFVLTRRVPRIEAVFVAVAVASTATSVGLMMRHAVLALAGSDPGAMTVRQLGRTVGLVLPEALNRLTVFSLWWAAIAGCGLAASYRANRVAVVTLVFAVTIVWKLDLLRFIR